MEPNRQTKMGYKQLDYLKTIDTITRLKLRIEDRFPESGLSKVCIELLDMAKTSSERIAYITKPIIWLRASIILVILIGLSVLVYSLSLVEFQLENSTFIDIVEAAEASVNDIIFIGASIYFLLRLETRLKRRKVLNALHELRTIAHVIDMHQLTKDPKSLNDLGTVHSPKREMTNFELTRYLDYCSEMLSLTGKVSALYANKWKDTQVLSNINDIESLTTNLSRKVWQKIMIVQNQED